MLKHASIVCSMIAATALHAGGNISAPVQPVEPVVQQPVIDADEMAQMPAETGMYNGALKVGTLGVGVDISRMVTPTVGLRLNVNGLNYTRTTTLDNIDYDGTLKLKSAGLLADYYPFESGFRFSGGAYYNGNQFSGSATPTNAISIDIGDQTYFANQVGRLDVGVEFQKFAPYVGLGWGNRAASKGWGISFDLGFMYQNTPTVTANAVYGPLASGTDAVSTTLRNNIDINVEKERQQIQDTVNNDNIYKWYPVVMLGLSYTF